MKDEKIKNGLVRRGKSWSYVLRVPDEITGKTKPKWVGGFSTEKEAKLARDRARVALATNNYISGNKVTVGEYLINWIDTIHGTQLKPTTLHSYNRVIRSYLVPGLGSIRLQELKPSHIQAFYQDLLTKPNKSGRPLAPKSVEYAGGVLRVALNYAVKTDNLLPFNPSERLAMPKGKSSTPTPWNLSELVTFLTEAELHRLGFFFRLASYTGARRGELLALRWSDFDGKTISITKSRSMAGKVVVEQNSTKGGNNGQRRVALDPETIRLFQEHRAKQSKEKEYAFSLGAWNNTGYVFTREDGLPVDVKTVSQLFTKISKRLGMRHIRLHDLRHLHATELLRLGEPLHVVAQRLGHRDAMVTATIYAHVSNEQAETASNKFANAVSGIA